MAPGDSRGSGGGGGGGGFRKMMLGGVLLTLSLLLLHLYPVYGENPSYRECQPHIDATIRNLAAKAIVAGETPSDDINPDDYDIEDEAETQIPEELPEVIPEVEEEEEEEPVEPEPEPEEEEEEEEPVVEPEEEPEEEVEEEEEPEAPAEPEEEEEEEEEEEAPVEAPAVPAPTQPVEPQKAPKKESPKPAPKQETTPTPTPKPAADATGIVNKIVKVVFGMPKGERDAKYAQPWQTHPEFKKDPKKEGPAVPKKVDTSGGIIHKFVSLIFGNPSGNREAKWAEPWQTHKEHKKVPKGEVVEEEKVVIQGAMGGPIDKFVRLIFPVKEKERDPKWAQPWQTHPEFSRKAEDKKQKAKKAEEVVVQGAMGGPIDKFVRLIFPVKEKERDPKWAQPWQTHPEFARKAEDKKDKAKKAEEVVVQGAMGGPIDKFVRLIFPVKEKERDPKWAQPWQTHPEFARKAEDKKDKAKKAEEVVVQGAMGGPIDKFVRLIFPVKEKERDPKWAQPWQTHPEFARKAEDKKGKAVEEIKVVQGNTGGPLDKLVKLVFATVKEGTPKDPKWAQPWQTHKEHQRAAPKPAPPSPPPKAQPAPKPAPPPAPKPTPPPKVEPQPKPAPKPVAKPAPKPAPAPKAEPEPKAKPAPEPAPKPVEEEPAPKPAPAPKPVKKEPAPTPAPKPVEAPKPAKPVEAKPAKPTFPAEGGEGRDDADAPDDDDDDDDDDDAGDDMNEEETADEGEGDDTDDESDEEDEHDDRMRPTEDKQDKKGKKIQKTDQKKKKGKKRGREENEWKLIKTEKKGRGGKSETRAPPPAPAAAAPPSAPPADVPKAARKPVLEQEAPKAAPTPAPPAPKEEEQVVVMPSGLRSRHNLEAILGLDEVSKDMAARVNPIADVTLKELKKVYESTIVPLETLYKYQDISNRHVSDAELFGTPLVLMLGPYSTGKSTFINYLLGIEHTKRALKTGAPPSQGVFRVVQYGQRDAELDGTALSAHMSFKSLQKFGQNFVDQMQGRSINEALLKKVTFVEAPGILEMRRPGERIYPLNDVLQWFIDRADLILVMFDYTKLDAGYEMEAVLDQLKGRETQTRILLNKADQVPAEELIKVQGSLFWNLSPLLGVSSPPTVYAGSFTSQQYKSGSPAKLFQAQEDALLTDLANAINARVENRIAIARRHAVRVRNHAQMVDTYLTTFFKNKGFLTSKHKLAEDIIENPHTYNIYEGMSLLTNISRYDLPDPEVYRDFFRVHNLYDFQTLKATCSYFKGCPLAKIDEAISKDLPELLERYRRLVEVALTTPASKASKAAPVPAPPVRGNVPAAATARTS